MKKHVFRLIAACLAVLMLAGCSGRTEAPPEVKVITAPTEEPAQEVLRFRDMKYVRPDMEELENALEDALNKAAGADYQSAQDAVNFFLDCYDRYATQYCLANIRYNLDLTDEYWEAEYGFCTENASQVDEWREALFYALAESEWRGNLEEDIFEEGFFLDYDEENAWDETFTELLRQESELQNQYLARTGEGDAEPEELAALLAELVILRLDMAEHWGSESYADFAWEFSYDRDYTPEQAEAYVAQVARVLAPRYYSLAGCDAWDFQYEPSERKQTLSYVRATAKALGGPVLEAYDAMKAGELYDIDRDENKFPGSFEMWIPTYGVPFLFCYTRELQSDKLTVAHEFGHFCNDYASSGSDAGIDVKEFFSQGMEYLSLSYGKNGQELTRGKLADSLCTFVEQAAFASFEQKIYQLPRNEVTAQKLGEIYSQVAQEFGFSYFGYDKYEFTQISHFFIAPMYVISYVVSNDAALQLYQLELEKPGAGARLYLDQLDTEECFILAFMEDAGLESPFAEGRLEQIGELYDQMLFLKDAA